MTTQCPKCKAENPEESKFCSECGTQLIASEESPVPTQTIQAFREELTTGSTFAGRYQIIEELGKGGMGKVYRALDKKLNEEVALKLIKPEIASDKKTLERFQNELKLARKIRHSNVGGMYELLEDKGLHYITMEYVTGEDLKGLIKRVKQIPIGTAISITNQICNGLSEAHKLGVVHRDLKPSNIMIDKDGNARIMDFGIARSLKGKGITGAGVMIGTPEYMSPEQVEGKDVDHRSDIYSLGVILYEMVTGRAPFEGDTPLSIAHKHKYESPQEPNKVNTQIPVDLNNVILKCLAKDKEQRYQSSDELYSELINIEKGIPTTESEISKRKPLTSKEITVQFTLRKALFPVIGAVALIIIALMIWHPWSNEQALPPQSDKPTLAIVYFENNTGDENLEYLRSGLSEWFITDLNQSKYLNVLSGDRIYSILKGLDLVEASKYSTEDLIEISRIGGAHNILKGSYLKLGENFVITITLLKPQSNEAITSFEARCSGVEEMASKVDELTLQVKTCLNLTPQQISTDVDRHVANITSSSQEALRFYVEGNEWAKKGDYQACIPFFEKAIAIDPEFAMAYRRLGIVYNNINNFSKRNEYVKKAFELSERVSDREKYRIHGDYYRYLSWRTLDKAIEAFEKLLELYPDDYGGHANFASLYREIEEWDKAIEHLKVNVQNNPKRMTITNLARLYQRKGMSEEAIQTIQNYIDSYGDDSYARFYLAVIYFAQGEYESAHGELDKSFALNPIHPWIPSRRGDIYLVQHDFDRAKEEYDKLLKFQDRVRHLDARDRMGALNISFGKYQEAMSQIQKGIELASELGQIIWKAEAQIDYAYICLRLGQLDKALKESEHAIQSAIKAEYFDWQVWALYVKCLSLIKMKRLNQAEQVANELKELIESGLNRKIIRYYYLAMGQIELENGNLQRALKYFEDAISLLAYQHAPDRDFHTLFYGPVATAYYTQGNLEEAERWCQKILALTTGRVFYGDIYAKSFCMLGKIYEQQGDTTKAIEHYEKFLDLWKDADPGIAEVDDARERLAGLDNFSEAPASR